MSQVDTKTTNLLVDRQMQRGLLVRFGFYLAILLGYFSATMWTSSWVDAPDGVSMAEITLAWVSDMAMWLPTSLIIVPLAGYDLLRFSHRFALPATQLREQINELASGHDAESIAKQEEMMWQDTLEQFNQLRQELVSLRESRSKPTAARSFTGVPPISTRMEEPIEIPLV